MARFVALLALVGLLTAQSSTTCPIDDSSAYFTGKTRTDSATGRLLYQYKCNRASHLFWARAS